MPRRSDLHRILVIGSGPIVIGQGAEFDYSGTQATKALKEEGYEVVLVRHGGELIGATAHAIAIAEDRKLFGEAMARIGLAVAQGGIATTFDEALDILGTTGYPAIIRPSFTLGGTGGGIAYNREEF